MRADGGYSLNEFQLYVAKHGEASEGLGGAKWIARLPRALPIMMMHLYDGAKLIRQSFYKSNIRLSP
jgi:hypothetical protein